LKRTVATARRMTLAKRRTSSEKKFGSPGGEVSVP
jgi:hypothetical protein